jgi:hypothetical protein
VVAVRQLLTFEFHKNQVSFGIAKILASMPLRRKPIGKHNLVIDWIRDDGFKAHVFFPSILAEIWSWVLGHHSGASKSTRAHTAITALPS